MFILNDVYPLLNCKQYLSFINIWNRLYSTILINKDVTTIHGCSPPKSELKVQEEQCLQTAAICYSPKWTSNLRITALQCEPVSSKEFQEEYLLSGYRHSLSKIDVKKKKKEKRKKDMISISPDTYSKVMLKIFQGRLQ